jgi:hypothetical protein
MPFVYDKTSRKVIDQERDIEIFADKTFRDHFGTFDYLLKQGELQAKFEVVFSHVEYTHITTADSKITGLPKGSEVKAKATDAVYVLEGQFREHLCSAFNKIGKADPTEDDYESYKDILRDGLTVLFTSSGRLHQQFPDKPFSVLFEKNIPTLASRRPDLLPAFAEYLRKKSSNRERLDNADSLLSVV